MSENKTKTEQPTMQPTILGLTQDEARAVDRTAKLNALQAAAKISYPAFVRAAWMQPTHDDVRSKEIASVKLLGELGEVCEIIGKRIRGDEGPHVSRAAMIAEIGDAWYYLNLIALQWNLRLGTRILGEKDSSARMTDYKTAIWTVKFASKLASDISEIMDYGGQLAWMIERAQNHIHTVHTGISELCRNEGIMRDLVEAANIEKLCKRYRDNGTLRGAGSDR